MTEEEERELRAQLARLQQAHRDLDAAIAECKSGFGTSQASSPGAVGTDAKPSESSAGSQSPVASSTEAG